MFEKSYIPWNKGKKCPQLATWTGKKQSSEHSEKKSRGMKRAWANGKMKGNIGKSWRTAEYIKRNCLSCDKVMEIRLSSNKKYCSNECKYKILSDRMKGRNNPFYGKKHSLEILKKISEKGKGRISPNKGKKRPDFRGEKHPNWIKNRENLIKNTEKHERNNKEYYYWRTLILKRDNHTCKINNKDCSGCCIVHHILPWRDYPELRYEINNGITLCQAHHPRKRVEEKQLIPTFQELVLVSNELI